MTPNYEAPTSIPVPSADLINYRFDQTDKKFEEMTTKLDTILAQNANFVSEDKVDKMVKDSLQPVVDQLSNYRWYWRSLAGAFFLAFMTSLAAFFMRGRK